ncbi:Altered inheritance of mitochondria protein 18 [Lachnellula arida]|uniref:Altered inheritance of mitochondria protein 18 n=1 Tax=Lachnellula arida TaxID=1316785 RepID=A0A8T9BN71_9HELO|nr:Altered inheritance of mitochondria protein 18 [Lachnellula arida]
MPLHTPSARVLRLLPRHVTKPQSFRTASQFSLPSRTLASKPPPDKYERIDPISMHRLEYERREYYKRRAYYSGAGFVLGMIAIWFTATSIELPPSNKPAQADSGRRPDDPMVVLGRERKIVVQKLGEEPEEVVDVVATGTSTVPTFPRVLDFYDDEREGSDNGIGPGQNDDRLVEYQLIGLGIRTVSFLGIEVYVVGMYVATDDIAAVQEALIRKIAPLASTLVAGEKDELKAKLYDPQASVEIWSDVLKKSGARTLVRIVPTKNTDFHHLRDAWVRSLTARAQANKEEFGDEQFGASISQFKMLFNRGSVPKGKELLLSRDKQGKLAAWYDDGKNGAQRLGQVLDERISRGIWLNYLGGKTVASEGARNSIINGVMHTGLLQQLGQLTLRGLEIRVATNVLLVDVDVGNGGLAIDFLQGSLDIRSIIYQAC